MELTLYTQTVPAVIGRLEHAGTSVLTLASGDKLEFKTAPGEKFFDETVPDGKSWRVKLDIHITET